MKLNPEQEKAVLHFEGPCIVTAVPGSGKTRVLTERVVHLVKKHGIAPKNILCTTFTNKAANEMRERVAAQVGDSASDIFINTFHGLSLAILRKYPTLIGLHNPFSIYTEKDQMDLMGKVARMQGYEMTKDQVEFLARTVNDFREDTENCERHVENLSIAEKEVVKSYLTVIDELNAVDFSGILFKCWKLLENPKVVEILSNRFRYIMVDEAQDMNDIQYDITKRIGPHSNLFYVGDYHQCVRKGQRVEIGHHRTVPIEDIKPGDMVLSSGGDGALKTSTVVYVSETHGTRPETYIRTKSGKEITTTSNHHFFVQRGICWRAPKKYFVYLMQRGGSFRIGTSQFYVRENRSAGVRNGFSFRCRSERADRGWVISYHMTEKESRIQEKVLSYKYGIPTDVFLARSTHTMFVQDDLDDLHARVDSKSGALLLMREMQVDILSPHWTATCGRGSDRSSFTVTLVGDCRQGTLHRYSIRTTNKDFVDKLSELGICFSNSKTRFTYRFDGARSSLKEIWELRDKVLAVADRMGHFVLLRDKAKIVAGDALDVVSASSLMPGDFLPSYEHGSSECVLDEIEAVEHRVGDGIYYDLEVAETHNFITSGIVHSNSIFSWRGAKPDNLLRFKKDYPQVNEIVLPRNYRSTSDILRVAQRLIRHNDNAKDVELISEKGDGYPVRIEPTVHDEGEADYVVSKINALRCKYKLKDFAILFRISFISRVLEQRLRMANIPYRIVGGYSFFDRREIKTALAYMQLVANPSDTVSFARAMGEPKRGVGDVAIGKIEKYCHENKVSITEACNKIDEIDGLLPRARETVRSFVKIIDKYRELDAKGEPIAKLASDLMEEVGYAGFLKDLGFKNDKERQRLDGLNELLTNMADYHQTYPKCKLNDYLQSVLLTTPDAQDDDQDNQVSLLTMHSAKGLEFPVVFIVGCNEHIVPHYRAVSERGLDEERRLMYVAITRAQEFLFLTHRNFKRSLDKKTGKNTFSPTKPSCFIYEISPKYDYMR